MKTEIRFNPKDLAAIDESLDQLEAKFASLVSINVRERRRLFKMGSKSEAFCRQALTVLDKNRQVAPPSLELDAALEALATVDQLRPRAKRIVQLAERMRDSEQLLGADVAKAARRGYSAIREFGENQGLEGLHSALSTRFSRRSRRNETTSQNAIGRPTDSSHAD